MSLIRSFQVPKKMTQEMLVGKVELVKERDGAEFLLKPLGFFLFLLLVVN